MGRSSAVGSVYALLLAASLASAGAAHAEAQDAPVATADAAGAPVPAPSDSKAAARAAIPPVAARAGDATERQIDGWINDDRGALQASAPGGQGPIGLGQGDANGGIDDAAEPRRIHGEVGVGVGSRGYREAYGTVSLPVGQASEVDLAVADQHANFRRGGGAEQRSVALGVYLDGRDVAHALSRANCDVPRWGVAEKDDPVVNPDGSCAAKSASAKAR